MCRRLIVFVLWSLVVAYLAFSVIVIINSFRFDHPNPYRRFYRPEDQLLQIERNQPPPVLHYNRLAE